VGVGIRDDVDHSGRCINWGEWAITADDCHFPGKGHNDSGAHYAAAPDLDHENLELRQGQENMLYSGSILK
jgi:hypothetical protein